MIQVTVPDIIKTSNRKGQNHSSSTHDCPFCQSTGSLFILGSQAASLTSAIISTLYTTPTINNQSNNQLITQPLLRLRVQVWFRELKRMLGSVEKQPKLLYSDDLTAEEREKTKTLPIILCQNCGATGWAALKYNQSSNRLIGNDLGGFYKAFFNYNPSVAFIFPREQDSAAGGNYSSSVSDSSLLCTKCLTINLPTAQR